MFRAILIVILFIAGCASTKDDIELSKTLEEKHGFPPTTKCLFLSSDYQCLVDLIPADTNNHAEKCLRDCALDEQLPFSDGKANGKFIGGGCWHQCRTTWMPEKYDLCIANYKFSQPNRPSYAPRRSKKNDDAPINYCKTN